MEKLQDINLAVLQDIQNTIGGRILNNLNNLTEYYIEYKNFSVVVRGMDGNLIITIWKSDNLISEIILNEPNSIERTIDILKEHA